MAWYTKHVGWARTIHIHHIRPYICGDFCQKYRIYTIYIWFWPTLLTLPCRISTYICTYAPILAFRPHTIHNTPTCVLIMHLRCSLPRTHIHAHIVNQHALKLAHKQHTHTRTCTHTHTRTHTCTHTHAHAHTHTRYSLKHAPVCDALGGSNSNGDSTCSSGRPLALG